MVRSTLMRNAPAGMGYLFLGVVLGSAYGISWRFGFTGSCQRNNLSQVQKDYWIRAIWGYLGKHACLWT